MTNGTPIILHLRNRKVNADKTAVTVEAHTSRVPAPRRGVTLATHARSLNQPMLVKHTSYQYTGSIVTEEADAEGAAAELDAVVEDAETLDEEAVVEIPARSQPTTKPALANQSEDGDKQPKKMNHQVTIV
jgi:hypothetical protein